MKCKCCRKTLIIAFAGTKYCSACSIHSRELIQRISILETQVKNLRVKLYGADNGRERLREVSNGREA